MVYGYEAFMLNKEFSTRVANLSIDCSASQMQQIINLDETKLSLETNVSSTLMCGSNAAGKLWLYLSAC
jgi:hypothetical protein